MVYFQRHFSKNFRALLFLKTHEKKNQKFTRLNAAHFCAFTALYSLPVGLLMISPLKDSSSFSCYRLHSCFLPKLIFGVCCPKKKKNTIQTNFFPFQKITCPSKFGLKAVQMSLTCQRRITLFFLGHTEFKINLCAKFYMAIQAPYTTILFLAGLY